MLRSLTRFFTFLLLLVVLTVRFGIPEILASEISSVFLVEQTNRERLASGLPPLQYNKKLERAAFAKAENMFKEQYWAHYGPNKESPWQFILATGYGYQVAGENLAKGFSDSQSVHDAWMASPTHRANILDARYQEIGIAVVKGRLQGSDVFLVVQMFGNLNASNNQAPGTYPALKITSPEDGDILEDGITDVRGDANMIEEPGVEVMLDKTTLGTAKPVEKKFTLQANLSAAHGDQTITAKAVGSGDTYLSDRVVVTIIKGATERKAVKDCLVGSVGAVNLMIFYYCAEKPSEMTATIGSVRYNADSTGARIKIPVASLPKDDAQVIVTMQFKNQANSSIAMTLSELGKNFENSAIAGSAQSILSSTNLRQMIQYLFAATLVLFLIYAIQLYFKKQLFAHRAELLVLLLLLAILYIVFNVGIVRI